MKFLSTIFVTPSFFPFHHHFFHSYCVTILQMIKDKKRLISCHFSFFRRKKRIYFLLLPIFFVYHLDRPSTMTTIDSQILAQCQEGDKNAFRWVVQTYQRMVFSLALKMLADEEDAKDVVQDTFVSVWQHIRDFDLQKSFPTWVYTIASRLCLDQLKSKSHLHAASDDEQILRQFATDTDNQRILENKEWVSIIKTLVEGLSPKQRLVFTLIQLEGLTYTEVEQITGMNDVQVKSNLYVARQAIRKHLQQLGYDQD
jgi:RNA polymerase sigma-70 factor (ECF subfamily)